MNTAAQAAPDLTAIKARQQTVWASGDYSNVGTRLVIISEQLCEAVDLRAGERVLDIATGNGITALAAARRYADVTGIDYVPSLIERAQARATADRLPVAFQVADAEALPFADGSFDVVLSTVGIMFAPDQSRAAGQLLRVCRSGGRIGLASWTPEGFLGRLFKLIAAYAPPPAGLQSPMRWGSEDALRELLGDGVRTLDVTRRLYNFRHHDAAHWIAEFRATYGPVHKLFAGLDGDRQSALERELTTLLNGHDIGGGKGLVVPAEYLEVVAQRR
ncbi:MAG TPA: methyltransferase domain-containing protein [Burkholderiaceae bacterium]|nr:methyltransferase domain-containing protein [Burkholderiaceae bacterium]